MGVTEAGHRPDLVPEARDDRVVPRPGGRQHLHGHGHPTASVQGPPDLAHAADSQPAHQVEVPQGHRGARVSEGHQGALLDSLFLVEAHELPVVPGQRVGAGRPGQRGLAVLAGQLGGGLDRELACAAGGHGHVALEAIGVPQLPQGQGVLGLPLLGPPLLLQEGQEQDAQARLAAALQALQRQGLLDQGPGAARPSPAFLGQRQVAEDQRLQVQVPGLLGRLQRVAVRGARLLQQPSPALDLPQPVAAAGQAPGIPGGGHHRQGLLHLRGGGLQLAAHLLGPAQVQQALDLSPGVTHPLEDRQGAAERLGGRSVLPGLQEPPADRGVDLGELDLVGAALGQQPASPLQAVQGPVRVAPVELEGGVVAPGVPGLPRQRQRPLEQRLLAPPVASLAGQEAHAAQDRQQHPAPAVGLGLGDQGLRTGQGLGPVAGPLQQHHPAEGALAPAVVVGREPQPVQGLLVGIQHLAGPGEVPLAVQGDLTGEHRRQQRPRVLVGRPGRTPGQQGLPQARQVCRGRVRHAWTRLLDRQVFFGGQQRVLAVLLLGA